MNGGYYPSTRVRSVTLPNHNLLLNAQRALDASSSCICILLSLLLLLLLSSSLHLHYQAAAAICTHAYIEQ
jgi:hypothetical protein